MRNEEQVKKGVEIGAMFERMSQAIEQLEELLQREVMRDGATSEMYLAIGRSSEHVHRSAKEHAAVSAEVARSMRNVNDTFAEIAKRAAGGVGATDGLIQMCAEAERQVDQLRARAEAVCSRLSEIVQLSRDIGGAEEP
jgi:methyl-accepting chemotaxis protein